MEHNKLRAKFQTEEVENNWAISYGDMITLLLGFFVIFFNIKTETINMTLIKKDIDKYFQSTDQNGNGRAIAETEDTKETVPVMTSDIANALQIKSNIDGERILVEFPGVSFFDSASHSLTTEGQVALGDFAKAISPHLGLFRLVVRGYTDALPLNPLSQYKDNLELSAFRSISAIRHLAKMGVNLENMRIAGYGESSKSREELDEKVFKDQRKIVIVIEPLDHTERAPATRDTASLPEKSIEEVAGSKIPKLMTKESGTGFFSNFIMNKMKLKTNIDIAIHKIDSSISGNPTYKSFVDQLVYLKLRMQGDSHQKAQRKIREYNHKLRKEL